MLLTAPTSKPLTSQGSYNITELFSGFHPSSLDPHLLFDTRQSMGSSGFLDSVATLSNLSEGPNAGGDATQTTALSQPKALPLIDGKGYAYLSGTTGNHVDLGEPIIPALDTFELTMEFYRHQDGDRTNLVSQYAGGAAGRLNFEVTSGNQLRLFVGGGGEESTNQDISGGTVNAGLNTVRLKRIQVGPTDYAFQIFINDMANPVASSPSTYNQSIYQGATLF